jgi:hypothetical protein
LSLLEIAQSQGRSFRSPCVRSGTCTPELPESAALSSHCRLLGSRLLSTDAPFLVHIAIGTNR